MIYANRDIILLNKRLDSKTRRDVYIPTQISGVTVYDYRQSTRDGGHVTGTDTYMIRIPIDAKFEDGRTYMPEEYYDILTDEQALRSWTLHNEDMIIICREQMEDVDDELYDTMPIDPLEAEQLVNEVGYNKKAVIITEYADNTLRGSDIVRHWRIGGV